MSLLSDHLLRKSNARHIVLRAFHELREVFASDLHISEKEHLFRTAHLESIKNRVWVIRPENSDLEGPLGIKSSTAEGQLRLYLESLMELLGYRSWLAQFQILADQARSIGDSPGTCNEHKAMLGKLVPHLEKCVEMTGLRFNHEIHAPAGGYLWGEQDQENYIAAFEKAVARGANPSSRN